METDAKKLPEHSFCADVNTSCTSALSNNLQQWNLQYNQ